MAVRAALDRREIETLFRTYGPLVRRRARSILGDEAEAEDATQEVFVRVLASVREFRGESQPSTWLYRITTNLCLNRLRDGKRHRGRLETVAKTIEVDAGQVRRPAGETRSTLRTVLARVAEDLAQVAVYYHVDEMDQEEIAALTGVSRRTVGYRLERFRDEARRILGLPPDSGAELPAADESVAASASQRSQKRRSQSRA